MAYKMVESDRVIPWTTLVVARSQEVLKKIEGIRQSYISQVL